MEKRGRERGWMPAPHLFLLDGAQEEAALAVGERGRLHGRAVRGRRARVGGGERARHRRAPRVPSARARPLREGAALTVLYQRPNALCLKPFPAIRAKPAPTQLRAVCLTPVPAHQSACPSSAAAEDAEVSPQPPAPGQCPQPASHGFPGRPLSTSKAQYLFHIVVPEAAPGVHLSREGSKRDKGSRSVGKAIWNLKKSPQIMHAGHFEWLTLLWCPAPKVRMPRSPQEEWRTRRAVLQAKMQPDIHCGRKTSLPAAPKCCP